MKKNKFQTPKNSVLKPPRPSMFAQAIEPLIHGEGITVKGSPALGGIQDEG
jgi:hypothetical protein